jgi:hypothetical protein
MKKTALAGLYGTLLFALPAIAFAQALQPLRNIVVAVGGIIDILIPILIALALVVFFWGLIVYIWKRGEEGKGTMIYGLIALFVMVSVWGIINLAQGALGINPGAGVNVPVVPVVTH